MNKVLITVTAAAVVGIGSSFFGAQTTHAETVSNLEAKQAQIQDDRNELKANLSDAEAEIADVMIELEKLNKEITKVNDALKENNNMISQTGNDIKAKESQVNKLEEEIAELEAAIEKRFDILKERAISYQQSGGSISYLEVIFGSQSFGDFLSRVSAVNQIAESDAALMEKQENDKKAVEEKQNTVLDKLEELNSLKVELEGMQAVINEQKQQNEDKKAQLNNKEAELATLVAELKIEDSNLASLEAEVKQSIDAASQPIQAVSTVDTADNEKVTEQKATEEKSTKEKSTKEKSTNNTPSRSTGGGNIDIAINAGFAHIGTPYVWGGKGPGGFDCSGFVSWAFAQAGISIPSSTAALQSTGTKVSASNMQPGDIVFFNTYKTNGHVGIYLGGGKFIGSQDSGLDVADMTSGYWKDHFSGHVRSVVR
ncbi:C40 family peptidase [Oceanobacillus chungangensis]|uniref:Peptidase n=1 Tax=Oceanobacillus chungangensis TaxID=1229152 RepID=A0A3D8PXU4_9BACI|nr:C40 family peptidase [Oceanobacillus chungangensis]RDW20913.1 peptidase [Oceanobacillus chungangensis]